MRNHQDFEALLVADTFPRLLLRGALCLAVVAALVGCNAHNTSTTDVDGGTSSDTTTWEPLSADAEDTIQAEAEDTSQADAENTIQVDAEDNLQDTLSYDGPVPLHRPTAEACPAPTADAEAQTCQPMQGDSGDGTCSTSSDCAAEGQGLCLDTHYFGGDSSCQCHAVGCEVDADCEAGQLCHCGCVTSGDQTCGGWTGLQCGHRCLPAECRTDADCGAGNYCSPSRDECGWQVIGWYCHNPALDECVVDQQCPGSQACWYGPDERRWTCHGVPTCD